MYKWACVVLILHLDVSFINTATADSPFSTGDCHSVVYFNFGSNSVCNKHDAKWIKKIDSSVNKISDLSDDVDQIKFAINIIEDDIDELKIQNEKAKDIDIKFKHLKIEIENQLATQDTLLDKKLAQKIRNIINSRLQNLYNHISETNDANLISINNQLDDLKHRVGNLENENRRQSFYYGVSIGATQLNDEWHPRIGLELEILIPKKIAFINSHISTYVEVSHLSWKDGRSYRTLSGLDEVNYEDDHSMTTLSLGGRAFFLSLSPTVQSYVGLSFGHTIQGEENTFIYGPSLGIQFLKKYLHITFEIKWDVFKDIESHEIKFDPLGDAITSTSSLRHNGPYAGLRISFR